MKRKEKEKNIQECSLHADRSAVMLVCMVVMVVALNIGVVSERLKPTLTLKSNKYTLIQSLCTCVMVIEILLNLD